MAEARRTLDEQRMTLEAVRNRMIAILGVLGVVFGLLHTPPGLWFWMVLTLVTALMALSVIVLWPRSFSTTVDVGILRDETWRALPREEFSEKLASYLSEAARKNESHLRRCGLYVRLGLIVSALTIVVLLLAERYPHA